MRKSILNFLIAGAASFAFLFGFASCGINPQVSLEDALRNADLGETIDIMDKSLSVVAGTTYTIEKSITLCNGDLKNSSIVVKADGVTLSNLSSVRNVTVGDSVADGDFYLMSTNVTNLVVNGGGPNSIHISGSSVKAVSVAKALVRIVLEATSKIANLYANTVCVLDSIDSAASYLSVVVKRDVASLTLKGSAVVEAIVTESANTEISVASLNVDIKNAGTADTSEGAKVSVTATDGVEVPNYTIIEKEEARSTVQTAYKAQEEIEKETSQQSDSDDFLFKVIDYLNDKEVSGAVSYSNGEYIFENPKVSKNADDIWNYYLSVPLPVDVKKGKNYRVSVDLKSDSDGYVLLESKDDVPMWSGNTKFLEVNSAYASYSVTTATAAYDWTEGVCYIAVGTVENLYIKNLIVEEIEESQNYPINVFAGYFDGYKTVSATEDTENKSVTLTVSGIAGEIWEHVYLANTPLETGKLYKVSFNMKSSVNLDSGDIKVWGYSSDDRYETSGSENFCFVADVAREIVLYMPVYQMKNETFRIPHIAICPKKDCSVTLSDIKAEETTIEDIQSKNPNLVLYYAGEASYGNWTYNDPSEVLIPAYGGECYGQVILCERATWDNALKKWNGGWNINENATTSFRVLDSAKNDLNAVVKRYGRDTEYWNIVFENKSGKNCYVKFSLNDKCEVVIEKIREETPKLYIAGDIQKDENTRALFELSDGSTNEHTYTFTYDSKTMTYWGGAGGKIRFKIYGDAESYERCWGGDMFSPVELFANSDWLKLKGPVSDDNNKGMVVINDLIEGNKYTLIVNYDVFSKSVSIKLKGDVFVWPELKAVVADSSNGSELVSALGSEIKLARSGSDYTSPSFLPTSDGNVSFYITDGFSYWGEDGTASKTVPSVENCIYGIWKADSGSYGLYADASGYKVSEKIYSEILTFPLCPYFIIGDFIATSTRMSSTEKSGVYEYKFVYNNDHLWGGSDGNVGFQIQQAKDNWDNTLRNAEITLGGDAVFVDPYVIPPVFYSNNLTVSGLEAGKEYVIVLTASSSGFTVGAYEAGQASY